ncbi:MAG: LamG-like jellyroll fold domain-containing protein [Cytophagales bacterium]
MVSVPVITVTNTADAGPGSLRQAILEANLACDSTIIDIQASPITIASPLPIITNNSSINGNGNTVSGGGLTSIFTINNAKVTISDLSIVDGLAKGGNGENSIQSGAGGGGGAGLGGGLAVLGSASFVNLVGVNFVNNKAVGGNGGNTSVWTFGGVGGNGGLGSIPTISGTPGFGSNSTDPGTPGGNGGLFSGGGGAGNPLSGNNTKGGDGGMFAGGGGYGIRTDGDANCPSQPGIGGQFAGNGGISCGGSNSNGGGGGAGLGGALFVYEGTVSLSGTTVFNGNQAIGGIRGNNAQDGQGKGGAVFVHTGATLLVSGSVSLNGNTSSDGACTGVDNDAYYNANIGAPVLFPAQKPYSLRLSTPNTQTSVALVWDFCGAQPIVSYTLQRSVGDTLSFSTIYSGAATSFTDNTITANQSYFYRVLGQTSFGSSLESSRLVVSTFQEPGSGKAISLGVGRHVDIVEGLPNDLTEFTISFWTKPSNVSTWARFFDFGNGPAQENILFARRENTNRLQFEVTDNVVLITPTDEIELNQWQHFAVTYVHGGAVRIYKNGILIASGTSNGSQPINVPRKNRYIGKSQFATDPNFEGLMDEFNLWTRALSQDEIRAMMCQKAKGNETSLAINFNFDEANGRGIANKVANRTFSGMLIGIPDTRPISGAPLGDVSAFVYGTGSSVSLLDTMRVTAKNFSLSGNQFVQLFKVNDTPNLLTLPTGIDSLEAGRYFGIFSMGVPTHTFTYEYANNPDLANSKSEVAAVWLSRENNAGLSWQNQVASSKINIVQDTLSLQSGFAIAEYVVGFTPPPNKGQALDFDGFNDGVVINQVWTPALSNLTLEASFLWKGATTEDQVVVYSGESGSHGFGIVLERNNSFRLSVLLGGVSWMRSDFTPTANQWYHVAAVNKDGIWTLYLDGVALPITPNNAVPNAITSARSFIGCNNIGGNVFNGSIDEVRIWNRPLCLGELNSIKSAESLLNKNGLIAQYSFNQGFANFVNPLETILIDSISPLLNNGILQNFALDGTTSNWIEPGAVLENSVANVFLNPVIQVRGNGTVIANNDFTPSLADSTDFGVANSQLLRRFSIRNQGNTTLNIINVVLSFGTSFDLLSLPTSIAVGDSAFVQVRYNPSISGSAIDTLKITSNDCNTPLFKFLLEGKAKGQALDFDGANDVITVPDNNNLDLSNNFTLSAWVYNRANPINQRVFHKREANQGYGFGVNNQQQLWFTSYGVLDIETPTKPVSFNTWHHIAVTYSNQPGGVKFYHNGNLIHTADAVGEIPVNSAPLLIGSEDNILHWNGMLDNLQIWNRVLCEAEIQSQYNADVLLNKDGLVLHYKFNQGVAGISNSTISTAIDSSGNGLNGTLSGFALTGTTSNWVAPSIVQEGSMASPVLLPVLSLSGNVQNIPNFKLSTTIADSTDFGSTYGSLSRNFRITNTGNADLSISNIVQKKSNKFNIGFATPVDIAPSSILPLSVTFVADEAGVFKDTIEIYSNDCNHPIYTFAIEAEALKQEPPCAKASNASVSLSWSAYLGANSYTLFFRNNNSGVTGSQTVSAPATTYTFTGLENNDLYDFALSVNGGVASEIVQAVPVLEAGQAIDFNGVNQYVDFPSSGSLNITNQFSGCVAKTWLKILLIS